MSSQRHRSVARAGRPLFLALALGTPGCRSVEPAPAPQPSFVLLLADDLGAGELGVLGHPTLRTPHLDALAARGLRLDRFYAAAPVCSPTRASVLTGRHPNRVGTFSWGHAVPGDEVTLAESLAAAGYATGHFGKWHVGSVRAESPVSPSAQGFETFFSTPNFFDLDPTMSRNGDVVSTQGEGSEIVVEAALDFVRAAHAAQRPFLAVVWFGSPHDPHVALEEDRAVYANEPEELRDYYGEITAMDRSVGRLTAELEALGIEEDTLVWFTSDNGPRPPARLEEATAGLRGSKGTLWEGGLRVPSIVTWPGHVPAGSRSAALSGTVDILPTVLELAGVERSGSRTLDGESLAGALLEGRQPGRARPLGFWVHPARGQGMWSEKLLAAQASGATDTEYAELAPENIQAAVRLEGRAAWIDGHHKLHAIPGEDGRRLELYDLAADPGEARDLAGAEPARAAALFEALDRWRTEVAEDLASRYR